VDIQNGRRVSDNRRLFRFELTARGIGSDVSSEGMRGWFDLAHEWIVLGFADCTGKDMQRTVWGLKE
jgi:hypothetical protein